MLSKYEQLLDTYNDRQRLNLYQWDGTPENPMWLADREPRMLPTSILNPAPKATAQRRSIERALPLGLDDERNGLPDPISELSLIEAANQPMWLAAWIWLGAAFVSIGLSMLLWLQCKDELWWVKHTSAEVDGGNVTEQ